MENYKIVSRWDSNKILYQGEAESFKALVEAAVLQSADLRYADLRYADLRYADLRYADLRYANLHSANLHSANLQSADLRYANLQSADLRYANLRSADLRYAKEISLLASAQISIVPEHGTFVGWKKCQNKVLVQLQIPETANRSNATGRKCRASQAIVLQVIGAEEGISQYGDAPKIYYRVGETVTPQEWNTDRWTECGGGIHFFLTRIEAENY